MTVSEAAKAEGQLGNWTFLFQTRYNRFTRQPLTVYNLGVTNAPRFMPRKSTASKSTATAPKAPRKTRTRKTTPAAIKTVTSPAVTKEKIEQCINAPVRTLKPVEPKATTVTTFKAGKVVSKELMRPTAPLIQLKDYRRDIINRWNIHNYEIQQLGKDFQKFFNFVQPLHSDLVNRIKTVEL